jgi:hypothetical protein
MYEVNHYTVLRISTLYFVLGTWYISPISSFFNRSSAFDIKKIIKTYLDSRSERQEARLGCMFTLETSFPTSSFFNRSSAFDINFNPVFRLPQSGISYFYFVLRTWYIVLFLISPQLPVHPGIELLDGLWA